MTTQWRFVLSEPLHGSTNMAVDEALLRSVREGGPPTIRIYSWDGPCISLGRLQDTHDLLDRDLCASQNVALVRRPTGGRALLHHLGEVTYSITASESDPRLGKDVLGSYRSVNEALVGGLHSLGVNAATRERPPLWPNTGVGIGCFEAAYRHEVYWAGRKIVASAQRRQGGALLQQGTIPGRETGAALASYLHLGPGERVVLTRELNERTGTLERALDHLPSLAQAAEALADSFRETWGIDLVNGALTSKELALVRELESSGFAAYDSAAK